MCTILGIASNWWSVAGLAIDVVGFSLIALEWRTSMYDGLARVELEQDLLKLRHGQTPDRRSELSPKAMKIVQHAKPESLETDDAFDKFMKNVLILDSVERLDRRKNVFTIGYVMVVVGFVLQGVGAWPC